MERIICQGERLSGTAFSYRIEHDWAKWPEGLQGTSVLNSCWGADGLLYAVTGKTECPVVVFDPEGNYVKTIAEGLFKKSHSIRYTKNDTLLIADAQKTAHVIKEIKTSGEVVRIFGNPGIPGDSGYDFDYLETMEKNGEAPTETKWNKNPASNARIDSIRKRGLPFCRPCDMTMAPDGELYAADGYGNCAVHHFDADGTYLNSWGTPEAFRVVHSVCLDDQNRLWIGDRENCRVQMFDRTGELLGSVEGNLSRIGAVYADKNYLYISELDGGVTIVDLADLKVAAQIGSLGDPVFKAHGVTADLQGNLYLATNSANANNLIRLVRE